MSVPVFAIILASLALSFAAAVGVNLQKLSMDKEEARCQSNGLAERPPYFQPLWLLGMTIVTFDAIGDFVFIGLAPQALLAPLGSMSLGFNVILAPFFHSEVVTKGIVAATAIIYCGTIVTVLYAPKVESDYDLENMRTFSSTPGYLVYLVFCILFLSCIFLHGIKKGYGMLHYCALSGCLGGQTLLLAKCTSELLLGSMKNNNFDDWTSSPTPYVLICGVVGTLFLQLHYLNAGLHKFDALRVVPVYQSFWTVFAITGGMIFFQEHQTMNQIEIVMYFLGIIILLIGVVLLVRQRVRLSSVNVEVDLQGMEEGGVVMTNELSKKQEDVENQKSLEHILESEENYVPAFA